MPNKTIYLSQELFDQTKNINASQIISKLLLEYFQTKKTKEELVSEAEKIKEIKSNLINEADKKINKIELEVRKAESIEEQTKEQEELEQHKLADKISNCINNTKEIFNVEITELQALEFIKSKNYNSIKEYLIEKRLISES